MRYRVGDIDWKKEMIGHFFMKGNTETGRHRINGTPGMRYGFCYAIRSMRYRFSYAIRGMQYRFSYAIRGMRYRVDDTD